MKRGDREMTALVQQMPQLDVNHPVVIKCNDIVQQLMNAARRKANVDPRWSGVYERLKALDVDVSVMNAPNVATCFTSPSGKIVLFSGMFSSGILHLDTDDALAAVLGHELGHLAARHSLETASSLCVFPLRPEGYYILLISSQSLLRWYWWRKKYDFSHTQELEQEADYIGIMLMANACFDPRGVPSLWQRMARVHGDVPENARTIHPPHKKREQNAERWMNEALDVYHNAPCINDPPSHSYLPWFFRVQH